MKRWSTQQLGLYNLSACHRTSILGIDAALTKNLTSDSNRSQAHSCSKRHLGNRTCISRPRAHPSRTRLRQDLFQSPVAETLPLQPQQPGIKWARRSHAIFPALGQRPATGPQQRPQRHLALEQPEALAQARAAAAVECDELGPPRRVAVAPLHGLDGRAPALRPEGVRVRTPGRGVGGVGAAGTATGAGRGAARAEGKVLSGVGVVLQVADTRCVSDRAGCSPCFDGLRMGVATSRIMQGKGREDGTLTRGKGQGGCLHRHTCPPECKLARLQSLAGRERPARRWRD